MRGPTSCPRPDDKTILFRLKQPFALLPDALGHAASNMCAIMPERLAQTDPFKQVTEMVGSGPFRFNANERVQASAVRLRALRPTTSRAKPARRTGPPAPKIVHFDRVEWHVMPDPATAAAALQAGEMDWWENPTADLIPLLKQNKICTSASPMPPARRCMLRPNHLYPPFDNPAIRRALLGAVDQTGLHDRDDGHRHVAVEGAGRLLPAGLADGERRGHGGAHRQARPGSGEEGADAAGYKGEKVALMISTDYPT